MPLFPVQTLGPAGDPYLIRVHLTPWRWWKFKHRIYLHVFYRGDADDPHDHPFDFGSLVLWGGYDERAWDKGDGFEITYVDDGGRIAPYLRHRRRGLLSWRYVKAEYAHKITDLHRTPSVTLVFRGPKRREWNFVVPGRGRPELIPWRTYLGLEQEVVKPVELARAA